eukprot:TRINITY_DN66975_c0_g1_i1.p1 TRINITY_DN66975_c0_g1~~TRINITY_DN66975_c0_g1_i1.p1  ORF type:complete len:238 (+),score=31.36 TRINITY_DN66975_c0_g1_i1:48-761(+)
MRLIFRLVVSSYVFVGTLGSEEVEYITPSLAVSDVETLEWFLREHPLGAKQALKLADPTGLRLTHWAASAGKLDSLRYLVDRGANPWEPTANHDGQNTLHVACISGHAEIVKYLLGQSSAPEGAADSRDLKDVPCLHRAALGGHTDIVEALLQARGDVGIATERTGQALHGAAVVGHVEVVEALLAGRADHCARNKDGKTPLDRALSAEEDEVVNSLRFQGSECDNSEVAERRTADL